MVSTHLFVVMLVCATANTFCRAFMAVPSQQHLSSQQKRPQQQLVGLPRSSSSSERYFFNFGKPQPDEGTEETIKEKEEEEEAKKSAEPEDRLEKTVENIFSFFFGKPEEEPMGLKRGITRWPEQYPAVIDEWADPVPSDDKEVAKLRPMLKNTNLEERGLTLTYDANRNGWDAIKFHQLVDKKGPALMVCTTTSGLVCGGYNPKGWVGYGEARGSIAAFLFVYDNKNNDGLPTKLRKVGGPALAQMDYPESGPQFSPDALVIPFSRDNPKMARSKLGSYYERFPDGTSSLFGRQSAVQLKDLKVYHGVWEEGEYIPFTDAEPFALY